VPSLTVPPDQVTWILNDNFTFTQCPNLNQYLSIELRDDFIASPRWAKEETVEGELEQRLLFQLTSVIRFDDLEKIEDQALDGC
jgi:hypothetical protein